MEHFYKGIQGWFNFDHVYSRALSEACEDAVFVEVGAWRGRSTAFMAVEIVNSGKRIQFHVVDTWRGSKEEIQQRAIREAGGNLFPEFKRNMERGGVFHLLATHQMKSPEAAKLFDDESIDFCFIDGAHDFKSVRCDVSVWLPKIRHGGVLAGHDIDRASVRTTVQEAIDWQDVQVTGNSWWWRRGSPRCQ